MKKSHWLTAPCVAAGLLLAGCATTAQPVQAPVAGGQLVDSADAPVWAHQASDLAPDPEIRFGVLPNGMRYVIRRNATPPGAASLRLRIDAGSLYEADDQLGVAHFVEHLALNETRNVPEGELIRILERAGLRFGPDTNAMTGFEQTVYMLDLPRTDGETVDTALFLMREAAGEATFSQEAVDRERPVVLSEERTRATPQYRMVIDELGFVFGEDLLSRRLPIGSTEVIRTVPRERIVDFYEDYYRPERATLIAVGDFEVAEMEAKIRERFGNWEARGEAAPDPAAPQLPERGVEADVFVEPGVPTRASMTWVAPLDTSLDSRERRIRRMVEQLGIQILNRRLERIAAGDNPPLIAGAVARHQQGLRAEVVQVIGVAQEGQWTRALQAIEQEQRRAVEHGFTQAELDREIAEIRSQLATAAAGADTRPSPQLAMSIVGAVNEERVVLTPAAQLELFEQAVQGLTADQVAQATRELFAGSGPLLYLASPSPVEGGEQAVLAAYQQSRQVEVAAPQAQEARNWPYENFGTPGQVVEQRELEGLGVTTVRFANGVRLTVKPTQFNEDEILVSAHFGDGLLGMPTDRPNPIWGYGAGGFTMGGLGQLSFEEMQEVLASTVYGVNPGASEDALSLAGRTRPEDFARQMQVLAAYFTDPGWRASAWDRLRSFSDTIHDQLESSPSGVMNRDLQALLRSGDRRWATPSREEMAGMPVSSLRDAIGSDLATGPIEVIVVGDISVEEAIRQTAATFGALPPRQAGSGSADAQIRFPAGRTETLTHGGRADQALGFIAWPTDSFYEDQRRTRGLNLLSQVFQLRLNEEIRERQGAAYSPNATHEASEAIADYGYFAAYIETPPQALDGFMRDAAAIARNLREQPISEDELQRARRPFLETLQRQRSSSNQWWLANLDGVQEHPERAESLRVSLEQYAAITPQELQQLARQYLIDDRAFRLFIRPAATE